MKKVIFVGIMLVLFAASGFAGEMKPAFYIGGGVGMPMSPDFFKDTFKMGFGFGGGVGFQVHPMFEVMGRAYYNMYSLDKDEYAIFLGDPDAELDGGSLNMIEIMAEVKFLIPIAPEGEEAPFQPYLLGNVGFVNSKVSDLDVSYTDPIEGDIEGTITSEGSTDIGFGFGAGFVYQVSPKAGIFVEGKYMSISTEDESTSYLPIRAGLKYNLGE